MSLFNLHPFLHSGARRPGGMTSTHARTPIYGSQTPMYATGSRTPMYSSQTPVHEGMFVTVRCRFMDL